MDYRTLIINHWIEVIFGVISAGIITLYKKLASKLHKQIIDQKALKDGTLALLRSEIIHNYDKYMEREYIPIYALENIEELSRSYFRLGGNGAVTKLIEELKTLSSKDQK